MVHADALRREATLADLVAKLQARKDPFGMNGPQISALQAANAAIAALDGQIASTCYPTLAALQADATKLFVDYRVYWLRVPQTHVIEAADRLAEARARLGQRGGEARAARRVERHGPGRPGRDEPGARRRADAKLGTPPTAGLVDRGGRRARSRRPT